MRTIAEPFNITFKLFPNIPFKSKRYTKKFDDLLICSYCIGCHLKHTFILANTKYLSILDTRLSNQLTVSVQYLQFIYKHFHLQSVYIHMPMLSPNFNHQSMRMTYLLHHSDTVFSRKPTENPPLLLQLLSRWVLATVASNATVLIFAFKWPISIGEGENAQMKMTTVPIGWMHRESIS